jgi:2-oxoglutarate dehydrogenase E2 component (dihydrolipoamide succinyltransferase)
VLLALEMRTAPVPTPAPPPVEPATVTGPAERVTRKALSPIRKRIAERLLQAVHSTAMLTTFNEIDMGEVMALRKRYKDAFLERYGVKLGVTSFFVKAAVEALGEFPPLNAFIDGDEMVQNHHYHIGVAVGSPRGLVVPVVRHADHLSFAEIEGAIAGFVGRIRDNKLELSDLEGGTFSITNGGVFGSLLSTPILNYPQSGILGLHKVEPRPVVVDGEIAVRPMMYVALSYDHRIVDGREAVQFLARIKALVEDPERLLVEV